MVWCVGGRAWKVRGCQSGTDSRMIGQNRNSIVEQCGYLSRTSAPGEEGWRRCVKLRPDDRRESNAGREEGKGEHHHPNKHMTETHTSGLLRLAARLSKCVGERGMALCTRVSCLLRAEIGSGSSKREQKISYSRRALGEADVPAQRLVAGKLHALQKYEACVHAFVVVMCG